MIHTATPEVLHADGCPRDILGEARAYCLAVSGLGSFLVDGDPWELLFTGCTPLLQRSDIIPKPRRRVPLTCPLARLQPLLCCGPKSILRAAQEGPHGY